MIGHLERRAEAISGELNSQDGCCKYAAGVCDDVDKAGGSDDGAAGAAGEGISTRRMLQTRCGRLRQCGKRRGG
jgi:hypothetical protein